MSDKRDISYALDMFGGKVGHYIISATGIVAALSWNTTMKDLIKASFPQPKSEIRRNVVYSILVTFLLILLIWILPTPSSVKLKYSQTPTTIIEKKEDFIRNKLNEYCQ